MAIFLFGFEIVLSTVIIVVVELYFIRFFAALALVAECKLIEPLKQSESYVGSSTSLRSRTASCMLLLVLLQIQVT